MFPNSEILKEGIFYYEGSVPCDIRIFKHNTRYGTGDIYDDEEIRNDAEGEFFYLEFGSTSERGKFVSISAAYLSIEEAIDLAEKLVHSKIDWKN